MENESIRKEKTPREIIESLKICKCICSVIVKDEKKSSEKSLICQCGRTLIEHEREIIEAYDNRKHSNVLEWNQQTCTATELIKKDSTRKQLITNAFGEIEFETGNNKIAKYIRCDYRTDLNKIIKILFGKSVWNLKPPKLIISVSGDAKEDINKNIKNVFHKGLAKLAISTNAWITTGGSYSGIMKTVGQSVGDKSFFAKQNIVLLGIANWTTIAYRNELIRKNDDPGTKPISYELNMLKNAPEKSTLLDPNHTHFILVDNAKLNEFGGEVDFRSQLESRIASGILTTTNGGKRLEPIPIIQVVAGGGPITLSNVLSAVENATPCIFIDETGRLADLMCDLIEFVEKTTTKDQQQQLKLSSSSSLTSSSNRQIFDSNKKMEIMNYLATKFKGKDHKKMYEQIERIFSPKYKHLLSTFVIDVKDPNMSIDLVILRALLKSTQENYRAQLELALTWDRVDIARNFIFTPEKAAAANFGGVSLDELMYLAILKNRLDFVKLFIKNGFNLKKFLTLRRLIKLYNSILNKSFFYELALNDPELLDKSNDPEHPIITFKAISNVIHKLTGNFFIHKYSRDFFANVTAAQIEYELNKTDNYGNSKNNGAGGGSTTSTTTTTTIEPFTSKKFSFNLECTYPEADLFMLSILTERDEMAKFFWTEGKNQMSSALIASKIYKYYARKADESSEKYMNISKEFVVTQLSNDLLKLEL